MKKNNKFMGIICAVGAYMLFGFSFLFTKQSVESIAPMYLLSWRFILAFVVMSILVLTGIFKINIKGKNVKLLVLMAIFEPVLYYIGETLGLKNTTTAESGAIVAMIPITTIIFSSIILKEKPTKMQSICIVLTVIGVLVIILSKDLESSLNVFGYICLFVAVIVDSMYVTLSRKLQEFTPIEKTYMMTFLGAVSFTTIAMFESLRGGDFSYYISLPFVNMDFLVTILYLSCGCSLIAFVLFNHAVSIIGAGRTSAFSGLTTVITAIMGVVLLHEPFTIYQGVGTVLVLLGAYGANKEELKVEEEI